MDTVEQITKFLEGMEEDLPNRVTNGMILLAIREERSTRQQENAELLTQISQIEDTLHGKQADRSDGLLNRLGDLESFQHSMIWLLSPIVLAFLSGVGVFLFNLVKLQ